MKTTFIETCIEILKKESNPTLQNIVSLAEQELLEIRQAVEQNAHLTGGMRCPKCQSMLFSDGYCSRCEQSYPQVA